MSVESNLISLLSANSAVVALVDYRFHPFHLPQNEPLPAITYQLIIGGRDYHLRGPSGLSNPHIQIGCWASSYQGAKALAAAVTTCLEVAKWIQTDARDTYEDDVLTYGVQLDWSVWHKEA